jgi:uncharacterized membrane protein (UPF0127 family)
MTDGRGESSMCPDCDATVPAGSYYCPVCGQPLDVPKPASYGRWKGGRPSRAAERSSGCGGAALMIVLAMFLLAAAACNKSPTQAIPTAPPGGALVAFRSHVVAVEAAVNAEQWQRGLMGRKTMPADNGMLFLFPSPQTTGFWMKDTLIPLSIAFMKRTQGQTYRVVRIFDMAPCTLGDKCPVFDPKASYDVALETNRGWFARHGVHVGSTGRVGTAPAGS